jgi:hypothetical protein
MQCGARSSKFKCMDFSHAGIRAVVGFEGHGRHSELEVSQNNISIIMSELQKVSDESENTYSVERKFRTPAGAFAARQSQNLDKH